MKFLVITHVVHKQNTEGTFAYAPYVREMNLWAKHVQKLVVMGPLSDKAPGVLDLAYQHPDFQLLQVPALDFTSLAKSLRSLSYLPSIVWKLFGAMRAAEHIHLRCPGNMGLLACLLQILFPGKPKTAKYAGNWDWNSTQPWSYRFQQRLLQHPWLTRNMTALVYGKWPKQTKNLLPFFTASYHRAEQVDAPPRPLSRKLPIQLVFAGTLTSNKRPALSIETAKILKQNGASIQLGLFGEGPERQYLLQKIQEYGLEKEVCLHGNVSAETLSAAFRSAHFLLFASQSEGWPKAVAEAMFWGCLPVTSPVSCVPQMLGQGLRGLLVAPSAQAMAEAVEASLDDPASYAAQCEAAMQWSRQYTLDDFEEAIGQILQKSVTERQKLDNPPR